MKINSLLPSAVRDVHSLVIRSVCHAHAGVYKSVISNKVGKATCYAHLYVTGTFFILRQAYSTFYNSKCVVINTQKIHVSGHAMSEIYMSLNSML